MTLSIFRVRFFCEISLDLYARRADVKERLNFILENLFATYRGTESTVFLYPGELIDLRRLRICLKCRYYLYCYRCAHTCNRGYCMPDLLILSLHYWNSRRPIRELLDFLSMFTNPLPIATSSCKLPLFTIDEKLE